MRIEPVDPRDESWSIDHPRYRVYFWARQLSDHAIAPDDTMWRSYEHEIDGAPDVEAVLRWARATAGSDRLFTVYVVVPGEEGVGLIQLYGLEPTVNR